MIRLCSHSQTRAMLLEKAAIAFVQHGVDFDEEQVRASSAKQFVYEATRGKFDAAMRQYGCDAMGLLVADTVVTSSNQILRKARCVDDARNILMTQSGNVTSIITCMIYKSTSLELIDISATDYLFYDFDSDALDAYLASGQWRGKAGACMVEGFCKPFIKEVRGYESTAMGLSVEVLRPFLTKPF